MNNQIFYFFYNFAHQSALFDRIIVFLAVYFPYIVVILAGIFLIKKWKEFFIVFSSGALAWVLSFVLKILIHANRPFVEFLNVQALFSETGFAFPSGHATFFMALAVSIFLLHKKTGYLFMFFALIIGLSRISAGVHFPIDILGGFILGGIVSCLFAYFIKKIAKFF